MKFGDKYMVVATMVFAKNDKKSKEKRQNDNATWLTMNQDIENCLIKKQILHPGTVFKPLIDGCKVHFHFQTRKTDHDNTLIDDSRIIGKKEPMVLVLGKKFKLEVWEVILKKMAVNEVAKFTVNKSLVDQYPFVSKTVRELNKSPSEKHSHMCAYNLNKEGIGHEDLNDLLKSPRDLEFIIELLKVEYPDDYEKESWQLTDEEKLKSIPLLREKGNIFFNKKNYIKAAETYSEAICYCEQLMNKEKPYDDDWNTLNNMKIPLLLNFSQCKLLEGDFQSVIEHCTTVLQSDPNNIKALFRRAKAHIGVWNPSNAIDDFNKIKILDPSLVHSINKELKEIEKLQKEIDNRDKVKLKNLFA